MSIAVIRNMDKQGRIVIPSEIRRTMNLVEGDPLEFKASNDSLLLRKYDHLDDKDIQHHLDILFKTIHCSVAVIEETQIIASGGIYIPVGTKLSVELTDYIQSGQKWIVDDLISATTYKSNYVDTIIPLGSQKHLLLFRKKGRQITDGERTAAQLIATLLTKE